MTVTHEAIQITLTAVGVLSTGLIVPVWRGIARIRRNDLHHIDLRIRAQYRRTRKIERRVIALDQRLERIEGRLALGALPDGEPS